MNQCQPHWTALKKSLEDCEKLFQIEWGAMEGVHDPNKEAPKDNFTVRRHENEESDKSALEVMSSQGAASTTK